jgi:hypothetical protein
MLTAIQKNTIGYHRGLILYNQGRGIKPLSTNKAIEYFQELFANELSLCMEIIPLAYRKAALCAEKLGNRMLQEEYKHMAENLFNEYRINVEGNLYTGY